MAAHSLSNVIFSPPVWSVFSPPVWSVLRAARRRLEPVLPLDTIWHLARKQAEWSFHRHMHQKLGPWFQSVDPGPPMSIEMRGMTSTQHKEELSGRYSLERFFFRAYTDMDFLIRAAERSSLNLRAIGSILEFGCGSARLLRLLRCIQDIRLVGTDTNAECVTWCQENVPGPEYYVNERRPPLAFAAEESFDLVYSVSVFTHIPLEWQAEWLQEMHRILRPGGFFLCTVLGWNYAQSILAPEDRNQLRREGQFTLGPDHPRLSYSSRVVGLPDVIQRRYRVIEAFGEDFHLLDFVPAFHGPLGQDLLILRKPE